jgi:hypothetical protein
MSIMGYGMYDAIIRAKFNELRRNAQRLPQYRDRLLAFVAGEPNVDDAARLAYEINDPSAKAILGEIECRIYAYENLPCHSCYDFCYCTFLDKPLYQE